MALRYPILQVSACASVLLATPTARAEETWCSDDDEALPAECFPDVLCPVFSNYWDFRRAVVHIYGPDIGGTGVLINNVGCTNPEGGDADCGAPYLLTAAHLLTNGASSDKITQGDIHAIENESTFTLGFESVSCGGYPTDSWEFAIFGAQVLDWSVEKDLMLLHLSTSLPAEAGPYFVGWGEDGSDVVAAITHACGGPKKIAIADREMTEYGKKLVNQTTENEIIRVESWDEGGVLGGSSGGPLLTENGKLIGIYSGSYLRACPGHIADSIFIALETIVPFIETLAKGHNYYSAYDSNAYLPIHDVELNSEKYGPGEVVQISARQKVVLSNGFHAEDGSNVRVIIVPAGP
jgi:hypothetical protein